LIVGYPRLFVGAVDDQDGKLQALEVGVAWVLGGAVSRERRALGGDGLVGNGRVAVGAGDDALDVSTPRLPGWSGSARTESASHNIFLPLVLPGEQLPDPGRERADALAATRPGAGQHQAAHSSGRARATSWATRPPIECPTMSTVFSLSASMKLAASRAIASMVSGTAPLDEATPAFVEQDDLPVAGEDVAYSRVVIIQGAHEVLEEHQRKTSGPPETAVGEADPAALGVLGGRRVMRERTHDASVAPGRVPGVSVT